MVIIPYIVQNILRLYTVVYKMHKKIFFYLVILPIAFLRIPWYNIITERERKIPNTGKGKKMTRKEMITACVEDQIARGIIEAENKEMQIKARLTGSLKMGWSDCKRWYDNVFAIVGQKA